MSEQGEHNGEEYLSDEAIQAETVRLSEATNREEAKIIFGGNTDPSQLDTYLAAQIALSKWIAHHPTMKHHQAAETEDARATALKYTKIFTGSYYTEKAQYCQERVGRIKELAGEKWNGESDYSIAGRKQAAPWLRMEANCLEMPTARPALPPQENGQK